MKRKVQFLLLLIIAGLVGAGVYTQKQENPDAPIVPDEIMGPLLELQQMVDQQQPSMNSDVQDLIKDVQDRFYALDDVPQLTREEQKRLEEERKNKPEIDTSNTGHYTDPSEAFAKIKGDISGAMNKLIKVDSGDLANRMDDLMERVKTSVDKTKSGVEDVIENSNKSLPEETTNDAEPTEN
ncbi:MAG: hypothetical protein P9L94_11415 [Candidatus Hinthialibacter antarcticus]|nr:hypothetical protein [Candidatus Hinthialibacter antarcticus]